MEEETKVISEVSVEKVVETDNFAGNIKVRFFSFVRKNPGK